MTTVCINICECMCGNMFYKSIAILDMAPKWAISEFIYHMVETRNTPLVHRIVQNNARLIDKYFFCSHLKCWMLLVFIVCICFLSWKSSSLQFYFIAQPSICVIVKYEKVNLINWWNINNPWNLFVRHSWCNRISFFVYVSLDVCVCMDMFTCTCACACLSCAWWTKQVIK